MQELQDNMQGGIVGTGNKQTQDNGDILVFPDEVEYEILSSVQKYKDGIGDEWRDKYTTLTELNADCIGYIQIPDTKLSYPVMFTPDNYQKYLYKNFSGEKETRGTPFLDAASKIGQSQNYIIYGHNMSDEAAFGSLKNYLKKSYYEDNKYIYFNTAVSEGVYEIMAVVKAKVYNVEDQNFKYYKYGGVLTKDQIGRASCRERVLSLV